MTSEQREGGAVFRGSPPTYPNLRAEMVRYGFTMRDIAEVLAVNTRAVQRRFAGKVEFAHVEMWMIRDRMFPSEQVDYLFGPRPMLRRDRNYYDEI